MQLYFDNSVVAIDIVLDCYPIAMAIQKMYQHLQHVPINFKPWDNPYYLNLPIDCLVSNLSRFGKAVGVNVDTQKCLDRDQPYLNALHKIYEQGYDGGSAWLDYHEHIHMCEYTTKKNQTLVIDYREKSGLLEKPFDMSWMIHTSTKIRRGDVYIKWAELGKSPYHYWKNSEPNDIQRLCNLAKPWLKLKPKLSIALNDVDFVDQTDKNEFLQWWEQYEQPWCSHWGIDHWGATEIFAVSVIGHINDIDVVDHNLQKNLLPTRIRL